MTTTTEQKNLTYDEVEKEVSDMLDRLYPNASQRALGECTADVTELILQVMRR